MKTVILFLLTVRHQNASRQPPLPTRLCTSLPCFAQKTHQTLIRSPPPGELAMVYLSSMSRLVSPIQINPRSLHLLTRFTTPAPPLFSPRQFASLSFWLSSLPVAHVIFFVLAQSVAFGLVATSDKYPDPETSSTSQSTLQFFFHRLPLQILDHHQRSPSSFFRGPTIFFSPFPLVGTCFTFFSFFE